jgi:hypothetical protein
VGGAEGHAAVSRARTGLLLLLAVDLLLAGCALLDDTPPKRYPSEIVASYVGGPLLDLEMKWSAPWDIASEGQGQKATWQFDGYNFAGCTVTVHTDAAGIIRKVAWTPGCGPKGTGTVAGSDPDRPEGCGPSDGLRPPDADVTSAAA